MESVHPQAPRFAADAMLGRLARWLRFLGYDTFFQPDIPDVDLVKRAWRDGRILLTRDTGIPRDWTLERWILIESHRPLLQLRQVVDALGLTRDAAELRRCTVCNGELARCPAEAAAAAVPPYVAATQVRFRRCGDCGRIYWEGTHVARMRRVLEQSLADSG